MVSTALPKPLLYMQSTPVSVGHPLPVCTGTPCWCRGGKYHMARRAAGLRGSSADQKASPLRGISLSSWAQTLSPKLDLKSGPTTTMGPWPAVLSVKATHTGMTRSQGASLVPSSTLHGPGPWGFIESSPFSWSSHCDERESQARYHAVGKR